MFKNVSTNSPQFPLNKCFNSAVACILMLNTLTGGIYEERFDKIYEEKLWGANEENEGFSGGGSLLENVRPYYNYLKKFLQEHDIKSVVDVGCGDWTFSKHVDWSGIQYTGVDVVGAVIEKNKAKYGADNIHFIHGNFLETDLPSADLLICKHVLQHMPNEDIFDFIELLPNYKHCLVLNAMPIGQVNVDHQVTDKFPFWEDRGIDLTLPPFNVIGNHVLIYPQGANSSGMDMVTHIVNPDLK